MAQTGTNQTSLVQTIDKWLEQHPALHVAYVDIARVKNSTNDWFGAESLGRKGLRLIRSGNGGLEAIRAELLAATANLLFFYWRKADRKVVLIVYVGPNASSLESARASVTAHTLTAALPNEGVIYVRSVDDLSDERVGAILDGTMVSSPSGVMNRSQSRHARKPSVRASSDQDKSDAAVKVKATPPPVAPKPARPVDAPAAAEPEQNDRDQADAPEAADEQVEAVAEPAKADSAAAEPAAAEHATEASEAPLADEAPAAAAVAPDVAAAVSDVAADAPDVSADAPAKPAEGSQAADGESVEGAVDPAVLAAVASGKKGSLRKRNTTKRSKLPKADKADKEAKGDGEASESSSTAPQTPSSDSRPTSMVFDSDSGPSSREGSLKKSKKRPSELPAITTSFQESSPVASSSPSERAERLRKVTRGSSSKLLSSTGSATSDRRGSSLSKLDQMRLHETIKGLEEFEIEHSRSMSGSHERSASMSSHERSMSTDTDGGDLYVAIEDNMARSTDDLMFLQGDRITVTERMSDTLWRGSCFGFDGVFDPKKVKPVGGAAGKHARDDSETSEITNLLSEDDDEIAIEKDTDEWDCFRVDTEILWLDMAGFSSLGMQFESGMEIDEEEALRSNPGLNKEQRAALVKRIRFLNETLQEQQMLLKTPVISMPKAHDSVDGPTSPLRQTPPSLKVVKQASTGSGRRLMSVRKPKEVAKEISSLTPAEMELTRKAAFADFTGLLERRLNIENPFRKALQVLARQMDELTSSKESKPAPKGVFGVDLTELTRANGGRTYWSDGVIPAVMRDVLDFLLRPDTIKTEGLFRISPRAARLKELCDEIDRNGRVDVSQLSPHDATGIVKQYLKLLPDPVFTDDLYKYYLAVSKMKDRKQQLRALQDLSIMLPTAHRDMASVLLKFMNKVTFTPENKMDIHNMAVVLSPSLFRHGSSYQPSLANRLVGEQQRLEKDLKRQEDATAVLKLMIEYHSVLFLVPSDIVHQVQDRLGQAEDAQAQKKTRSSSGHTRDRSF